MCVRHIASFVALARREREKQTDAFARLNVCELCALVNTVEGSG